MPIALIGGMVGLYAAGYSVNTLTLFAMVLAVGIVVDDAIVVVENVERIMTEEGLRRAKPRARRWGRYSAPLLRSRWCYVPF